MKSTRKWSLLLLISFGLNIGIHADTHESVIRTSKSDEVIRIPLSKNVYRTEIKPVQVPYEIPYSVTVPYIEKIPYEVSVPYMRQEEYTVQVPTMVRENYNVEIPYTVDETYNETVESCRIENIESCRQVPKCQTVQKCNTVPGACRDIPVPACQPVCQNIPVEVCQNVPQCVDIPKCTTVPKCTTLPPVCREITDQVCKTAPDGTKTCTPIKRRQCDPPVNQCHDEQVCKTERSCTDKRVCQTKMENRCSKPSCDPTRRVCDAPTQQCRAENICHDERFCEFRPERRCYNQIVQRTRRVTKVRIETRTREVPGTRTETRTREVPDTRIETRYRDEQRTRVETRYRTEYKTENRPVSVLDHSWKITAEIHFPAISRLEESEQESVSATLGGNEQDPKVDVQIQSRIFEYQIVNQSNRGSSVQIELDAQLKVDLRPEILKDISISLSQNARESGLKLQLQDRGRLPRVQSRYSLIIRDVENSAEVFRNDIAVDSNTDSSMTLTLAQLSVERSYEARLEVVRTSDFLDLPNTGKELRFEVKAQYEATPSAATLAILQDARRISPPKVSGVLSDLLIQVNDATTASRWAKTRYSFKIYRQKKFLFWSNGFEQIGQTTSEAPSVRVSTDWVQAEDIKEYLESGDLIRVEVKIERIFAPTLKQPRLEVERELEIQL